jgi:nucleoid-associated protein YgaU
MGIFSNMTENQGKQSGIGEHLRSMAGEGSMKALDADAQKRLISEVEAMSHSAQGSFFDHFKRLSSEQLKAIGEGADPSLFYADGENRAQKYTVRRGDTLSKIAAAHKVALTQLLAANPQIENPDLIYPDQVIKLP